MLVFLFGFNLDNIFEICVNLGKRTSSGLISKLICCPVQIDGIFGAGADAGLGQFQNTNVDDLEIEITISNILWKKGQSWGIKGNWKGIEKNYEEKSIFPTSNIIKISEKRIAVINSKKVVLVKDGRGWNKIFLLSELPNKDRPISICAKDVAVEDNYLLILDEYGTLYSSGVELPLPGVKICNISVGKEHYAAVSETGVVYSWGSGMRGQLGNGSICQLDAPEVIQCLQGVFIKDIKCGGWYTVALSLSGDVYMWGWNDVGQLGFHSKSLRSEGVKWHLTGSIDFKCSCPKEEIDGDRKRLTNLERNQKMNAMLNCDRSTESVNVQTTPRLLDYWKMEYAVKKVACGSRHTVFLLEEGSVWTVGWNKYGQLGIGSTESKDEPQLLDVYPVANIFAGGWSTALVQE